jgi:O-antigen chain-terminating methyltransferase
MQRDFDDFYAAFSERFRGPFGEIKERLRIHADHLRQAGGPPGPILDLGTGRGEWLEVARECGWEAVGVDNNPRFIDGTRARRLNVVEADVLDHLAQVEPESLGAVTAFHIVEHLPAAAQLRLFREVFRVLRPRGFFIVEWPNLENTRVAQYNFWFDPTHRQLLPHELVAFMAEHVGFREPELWRLDAGKVVDEPAMDIALSVRKPAPSSAQPL